MAVRIYCSNHHCIRLISTSDCTCDRRSLDAQLCILVIPDLASSASRVVLSVSLERVFHHGLRLKHLSMGTTLPGPKLSTLSLLFAVGCLPMMVVPSRPSAQAGLELDWMMR